MVDSDRRSPSRVEQDARHRMTHHEETLSFCDIPLRRATIVVTNVCSGLTSHNGKDFATICSVFQQSGYAVVEEEALFVIGVRKSVELPGKPVLVR